MRPHLLPAALLALALPVAGCSSRGDGSGDRDGDGIPNSEDAFPDDPGRFTSYATVLLQGLAGGAFGTAVDVNGRGEVVGLSEDAQGAMNGVRWTVAGATAGAPVRLEPLSGNAYSAAYAIGDDGLAVGESASGGDVVAVAWPAGAAAPVALGLSGFGAPAAAYGVSGSRIVGEASAGGSGVAVMWNGTGALPVALPALGGTASAAYAVSSTGLVVGEAEDGSGARRGALWRIGATGAPAAPVALLPLPGHVASVALGVNAGGEIVGESESAAGDTRAVIWRLDAAGAPGAPRDLGVASASAVNAGSRVVGTSATPASAVLWDGRSASLSDSILTGTFTFSQAYGVNDLHFVVGMADDQGFVALPR